ncbi:MAG: hypothetical protein BWY88_01469 [Synergistetes bacterium ADurb.Bin520]|nr:MAG: hypothetical protein BWY88_01469 [Synergistetes bacterium ADurb.Bin520]
MTRSVQVSPYQGARSGVSSSRSCHKILWARAAARSRTEGVFI